MTTLLINGYLYLFTHFQHGDMDQKEREKILANFRSGSSRVLIATESFACVIDGQQVSLIMN